MSANDILFNAFNDSEGIPFCADVYVYKRIKHLQLAIHVLPYIKLWKSLLQKVCIYRKKESRERRGDDSLWNTETFQVNDV